jgi:hypothetical protein
VARARVNKEIPSALSNSIIYIINTCNVGSARFSGVKNIVIDRRNRLGIISINAQLCLKSWYKVLNRQVVNDCDAVLRNLDVEIIKIEEEPDLQLSMEVEALERAIGPVQIG